MKTTRYIIVLALALSCAASNLYAAITSSYYSTIDGKSGKDLFDAVQTVAKKGYSTGLSYNGLWSAYCAIDINASGYVWDMYSGVTTYQCGGSAQGANYNQEGDSYNREHSIPKSWFGGSTSSSTPGTDLFHVVPTDGFVNNKRSNYAFGEVSSATYTSQSGCKLGTPKSISISNTILNASGSSSQSCSKSPVFEPMDEYKGDFARGYFGTMVKWANGDYQTFTTGDGAAIFNTAYDATHYYGLTGYGVALLLKWHREDPVSQKEIDRNNGIQTKQGNRNPFIDYPCLAEYLWGNKAGETVTLSELVGTFDGSWTTGDGCPCGTTPAITLPAGSEINVGSTQANQSVSKTVTVQAVNLTGNITLALSGTNSSLFSINATTMLKAAAEAGSSLTITYSPTAAGTHTATLTISGGGLASNKTYTLSGTCCNPYQVTLSRNGITETVSSCGTYTLPTADDEEDACSGWTFQGWLKSGTSFTEGTTTKPTFVTSVTNTSTLHAVYGQTTGGGGASSATYTFSDKSWSASPANWTSGKDGNGFTSGQGVQITTGATGANATCATSYSGVTSIVVSYCTNSSKGAGTIEMDVNGTKVSQTVSTSGGTTPRDLTFDFSSTKPSGTPKITVTCSTNSIYINSITINCGSAGTTTYKKQPCSTYTITLSNNGSATGGTFEASASSATAGTTITLEADPSEGYELSSWTVTKAGGGTVTVTNNQFTMPDANVTVSATFSELPKYNIRFYNNGTQIGSTQQVYAGSSPNVPADPEACEGYEFAGWWTSTLAADNTESKTWVTNFTVSKAQDYHAVFSKTTSGGGAGGKVTINTSTSNLPTAYGTANTFTEYTLEGYKFKIQQMYLNSGKLQWRALGNASGTGTMYNTQTFPGKLSSIVITYNSSDANKNFTLNVGATQNPTSGTSITPTSSDNVYTFDCSSANADFFVLTNGTGAGYLDKIEINYVSSTTYYSTTTDCEAPCTQLSSPNVIATAGDKQITLTWADVTDADHYTVTIGTGVGYTTECADPSIGDITHSGTLNTCVITGLVNGLSYTTSVVANAATSSCDSEADEDTTVPDAAANPGDATVEVDGEADASDLPIGTQTHITITSSGHLTVSETTTAQALTLEYSDASHAQVTGISNLMVGTMDMQLQLPTPTGGVAGHWYAFGVPFEVSVATGIRVVGAAAAASYGYDLIIDEYNGALRATDQDGWRRLTADDNLVPGKLYMLYPAGDAQWQFTATNAAEVSESASVSVAFNRSSAGDHHSGWNGIASTYWSNASATLDGVTYATLYNNQSGTYSTIQLSGQTLAAATPFFVQATANATMYFDNAAGAPWRVVSSPEVTVIELTNSDDSYTDRAFLTVSADKQDRYLIGSDLEKMTTAAPAVPQLWIEAYDMQLAAHELALGETARTIPLGLYAPGDGEYILSIRDVPTDLSVTILKDGKPVGDNIFTLRVGDNEGYSLLVRRMPELFTGEEETVTDEAVIKLLKDDQLLIIRGGKIFTVTGVRVQ